jgi:hypothetical protein
MNSVCVQLLLLLLLPLPSLLGGRTRAPNNERRRPRARAGEVQAGSSPSAQGCRASDPIVHGGGGPRRCFGPRTRLVVVFGPSRRVGKVQAHNNSTKRQRAHHCNYNTNRFCSPARSLARRRPVAGAPRRCSSILARLGPAQSDAPHLRAGGSVRVLQTRTRHAGAQGRPPRLVDVVAGRRIGLFICCWRRWHRAPACPRAMARNSRRRVVRGKKRFG